ncbi:MAG: PTS sugar transporter subunit IIA [Kiritimatiellia bacterium]|jgi:PTS system nitrogen regulatory IIA component|nr:PTS sugar transporter subunit IIA [Kiritimatiellia bacterium]MDP6630207.1 PTS sugar transporter subunit IIA [Kiritimatiellia bacterium]MDP6810705.1 PTS sugar transporter subunit IIA [Kiritimatiellia bacterium]MDP7023308.1 PTS sugar transporter subunit IIA [Kiritimatiellia bacterium]
MDDRIDFEAKVRSSAFVPHLHGDTKEAIIAELIDALDRAGKLSDRDEALKVVMDREATMSTGLEDGVALPHGKSMTLPDLVAAFGLKPEGVDFKALDGNPSTLFVLVVSPVTQPTQHIQFLGELGRALMCPAVREKLLEAETIGRVADVLVET